jgi:hypothetical protein
MRRDLDRGRPGTHKLKIQYGGAGLGGVLGLLLVVAVVVRLVGGLGIG